MPSVAPRHQRITRSSPSLPHRQCLKHRSAILEDMTTASDPSLDSVHPSRQSLLWHPWPISSHDDFRGPTRRQHDLHPHRRSAESWADADLYLAHFHPLSRSHSSLLYDSVSLRVFPYQWHREIRRDPSPIQNNRCRRWSFLRFGCHFDATTVSIDDFPDRRWEDCRSLCQRSHPWGDRTDQVDLLFRCHRRAPCHSWPLASMLRCVDSRSQRQSPCPPHPHRDFGGSWVGFSHCLVHFHQR